jgi:hypothetical protein
MFLSCVCSYAQGIKIIGKVTDTSSIALPYASVCFYSNTQKINAISNINGEFILNINQANAIDSLRISYTGYSPLFLSLKEVTENESQIFVLKENAISLKEVKVNPFLATQVLKEALKKSSKKYPSPLILKGYYREYSKRENNKIALYADGIINYYIEKVKDKRPKITVSVIESRVKKLPIEKNEEELTAIDNPFFDMKLVAEYIHPYVAAFTDSTKFENFEYQISETIHDNKELYSINFKPKIFNKEHPFYGHIHINKESGLIMNIVAEAMPQSDNYIKSISLLGMIIGITQFKIHIAYEFANDNYYISHSSVSLGSKISNKGKYLQNFYSSEFFTKSVDIQNISRLNNLYTKKTLSKKGNNYTYEFWKDNLIPPNTNQEKIFLDY